MTRSNEWWKEKFPDADVADRSFYIWLPPWDVWFRQPLPVGQRFQFPHDCLGPKSSAGILVYERPEATARTWPGRLIRVGQVSGLERHFRNSGYCQACTILDELPPTQAFGPGGVAAAALTERAASFSANEIRTLGDIARAYRAQPSKDPIAQRLQEVIAHATKPPNGIPQYWSLPMLRELRDRWIGTALSADPVIGPGHLVEELWEMFPYGPYLSLSDESLISARSALGDALNAELWSGLIDADMRDWLRAPWCAGMAAIGRDRLASVDGAVAEQP